VTSVYFASNRRLVGSPTLRTSYGSDIISASDGDITYAVATVDGINLTLEGSGTITAITGVGKGSFPAAVAAEIETSPQNILVFLHGFANAFEDAVKRAAFNREWFAASGVAAANTLIIAFSWPSLGQLIAAPPHLLPHDYLRDQGMAQSSGPHVTAFLRVLQPILTAARQAQRRTFLLAHSMGNYVLQGAVQSWFAQGFGAAPLFDEAFLAAADERDDSFAFPPPARLSSLPQLASRISVYHSVRDIAMFLSMAVNLIERIGFEGPDDKSNPVRFPPARFRIIDCAEVNDYNLADPPDASHQYYRRSPKVRADIAATMGAKSVT
jgi:esterase/lipase superfamily enzyme